MKTRLSDMTETRLAFGRCIACGGLFRFGDRDFAESEASRICPEAAPEDRGAVCQGCFDALLDLRAEEFLAGPSLQ